MESVSGVPGDSSPCDSSSIYSALDPQLPEIRVLKLLPSSSYDAPLECRLVHRALHDEFDGYEALSYVWGGNEFTAEIRLNNKPYFITQNLDMALRHLRRPSDERTLWVDALCINQHDLVERCQQVLLMKDIYARCTVDLAWMLKKDYWSTPEKLEFQMVKIQDAFELMQKISFKDAETLARMREGPFLGDNRDAVPGEFLLRVDEQESFIAAFGYTSIWWRIWTMQEFAYAPKLKLVAGPHELDWDVVAEFLGDRPYADAFHAAFGHRGGGRALDLFFSGAVKVHDQRRALCDENYKSSLLDVLARFGRNSATDPRDCVFGILGLVTDEHDIVVDYTKSPTQLFLDTTLSIINAQKNFDVFCQTAWMTSPRLENPHDLPSWVPDFSDSVGSNRHRGILFAQRGIFAAGRAYINAPCRPINTKFLPVKAVVLGCFSDDIDKYGQYTADSIEDFRKRLTEETKWCKYPSWSALEAPFKWLEASKLGVDILDGEIRYDRTGESSIRAYWRTLLTDCGAYPITRLSEQEMLQCDDVFRSILRFLNDRLRVPASEDADERPSMDSEESDDEFIKSGDEDESIKSGDDDESIKSGGDDVSNETLVSLWESLPKTASTMWLRNYQRWMFSVTDNGLYTMVHNDAMAGDTIFSVEGAKVPMLLRKQGTHDGVETYSLVGTAYVHGYMDGEALDLVKKGELQEQEILLR